MMHYLACVASYFTVKNVGVCNLLNGISHIFQQEPIMRNSCIVINERVNIRKVKGMKTRFGPVRSSE